MNIRHPQFHQINRGDISIPNREKAQTLINQTGERNTKYCVLFLRNKREERTAWFHSKYRAKKAFDILTNRGFQSTLYID